MKFKRKLQSQSNAATTSSSDLFRGDAFAVLGEAISKLSPSWVACIPLTALLVVIWSFAANAANPEPLTPEKVHGLLNTIWVLIASILVIFMNAGFCMLETGFCRQKNAVNVLSKNLIVFALATLTYWAFGFAFMFGGDGPFMGFSGFFLSGDPATYGLKPFPEGLPVPAFFLFEVAFAGTAATIVSGAVAERIQYRAFLIFSVLLVGFSYSITGHWVWCSGGWLKTIGFRDFAGSTVVHCVGGFAALMGAAILGPRMGKYQDGQPTAMPGHNMSIATLGCLILWIGWFGFNPGSQLAVDEHVPYIAVITNLAAAAGGITSTIASWLKDEKPDLSMTINGILAGLVSITASCNNVSYFSAVIIGGVGGILVVFAVGIFDSVLKIDDPVGATSVHLVNGIWGTLAVGIFDMDKAGIGQFGIQLLGILSVGGFTVLLSTAFWVALKQTIGIRVSPEEEKKGLDIGEHGMEAYSGFLKDTRIL